MKPDERKLTIVLTGNMDRFMSKIRHYIIDAK